MPPKKALKKVTKSTKKAGKQPTDSMKNYTLDDVNQMVSSPTGSMSPQASAYQGQLPIIRFKSATKSPTPEHVHTPIKVGFGFTKKRPTKPLPPEQDPNHLNVPARKDGPARKNLGPPSAKNPLIKDPDAPKAESIGGFHTKHVDDWNEYQKKQTRERYATADGKGKKAAGGGKGSSSQS
jgi:hypothetical protein